MYRFRLQRVLDHRHRHEEKCQNALRQVQLLQQQEEAQLAALHTEAQDHAAQLEALCGTTVSPAELQSWQRYHEVLAQRITAQQAIVAQAHQIVAEHRQLLLVARQETKIIEKLRDKAKQRYVLELANREQQLLDELALTRSRHES